MSELEQALADIRLARQSHVDWAEYLDATPERAREMRPQAEVAGSADYHRDWVAKYDRVLRLLESPMEQVAAALTGRWQTAREISDRDGRERWRK